MSGSAGAKGAAEPARAQVGPALSPEDEARLASEDLELAQDTVGRMDLKVDKARARLADAEDARENARESVRVAKVRVAKVGRARGPRRDR